MNLYNEVIEKLKDCNKTIEDVKFITCDDKLVSNQSFLGFAMRYDYDEGFGSCEVNDTLKIVGDTWWLERHEYDGSEWFEFKELPIKPNKVLEDIEDLNSNCWK